MAIRYDKKLNYEIMRTINNFNRKVRRLEKQGNKGVPDFITKKGLSLRYDNRKALLKQLKSMQEFSSRGGELNKSTTKGGVELTKYELQKLNYDLKRAKKNVEEEIERLKVEKPTVFGREQDVTYAQMGDERYLSKKAILKELSKDYSKLDKETFNKFRGRLNRELFYQEYEVDKFKDNYFKMVEDLGYFYNVNKDKLKEVKSKLYKLKPEQFIKVFNTDKAIKAITEYYPIMTGRKSKTGIKPPDIASDVNVLFNNLYENIDEIVSKYE